MKWFTMFAVWFVVVNIINTIMMYVTTIFVGPQDFSHIGYTIILVLINIKIYFILNSHISVEDKTNE